MDKKDIYEHLAKIYLDASLKTKKKQQEYPRIRTFLLISLIVIFGFTTIFLVTFQNKNKSINSKPAITGELALVLQPSIVKINFNFEPVKKECYTINLNKLDLARFKKLGFYVRKANFDDIITLNVGFTNAFNESSEIYIAKITSYKWQECKISLQDFKDISDWSQMLSLSFTIDEWNTKEKKGVVYIDNIRLLR